jgi:hypothetical protein
MSPTLLKVKHYRFLFFSREEKRMHVHIISSYGEAKYWLEPEISLAKNYNFNQSELNEIEQIIRENLERFKNEWQKHFKDRNN